MTESAKLVASDGGVFDQFGFSVAIHGDTIVVAAWLDSFIGSAYVFVKPETGWQSGTETAKLTASDRGLFDQFGVSVAIEGDTVVVGAWRSDSTLGAAYVFVKPPGGWATMTETAKLTAADAASSAYFGTSVDIGGGTIVVGAYGDRFSQGAAYIFAPAPAASTPPRSRPRR
jgi:hypothetical protein